MDVFFHRFLAGKRCHPIAPRAANFAARRAKARPGTSTTRKVLPQQR